MAHSSCFPLIVRIALTPRQSDFLANRDSDGYCGSSNVVSVLGAKSEAMAATSSWNMLEGWGDRLASPSLGAVSGMVVLPDVCGHEQGARWFDNSTEDVRMTKQLASSMSVHASNGTSEESSVMGLAKPRETRDTMGIQGRRVVLVTGTEGLNDTNTINCGDVVDPANGVCILEHGLVLDAKAEGSIGLHEGATLFAQPVTMGVADCSSATRRSRSWDDDCSGTSGRRGGNDKAGCGDAIQRGHVLLLSDRVRSRTHTLVVSPDGEAAPAISGATEVHMSRAAVIAYLHQVLEQDIKTLLDNASLSIVAQYIRM